MWIIKKIGFVTKKGKTVYDFFQTMTPSILKNSHTVLYLSNTETGDLEVLHSTSANYLKRLVELRPYGFIDHNGGGTSIIADNYLIQIDSRSLQMLDWIEDVEETRVLHFFEENKFMEKRNVNYYALDDNMSLFVCDTNTVNGECACTLLDAMLHCSGGWRGDKFYLNMRRVLDFSVVGEMQMLDIVLVITFCNVSAAKSLYTKCLYSGKNPVKEFASMDFF